MSVRLSSEQVLLLLERMCAEMEAAQAALQELDAKAGDGDLGVTVQLGFRAVCENLRQCGGKDIGTTLVTLGMAFNAAAASTFGTLMATAFMRAGRPVKGKMEIGLTEFVAMMEAAVEGIKERGKAAPGERTMLDALIPAAEALAISSKEGKGLSEALIAAAAAAEAGAQATAAMIPRHGRAGWIARKPIGVPDAGAVAVARMLEALSDHLAEAMTSPEGRGNAH
jgi:dihydroxyacetone kinase